MITGPKEILSALTSLLNDATLALHGARSVDEIKLEQGEQLVDLGLRVFDASGSRTDPDVLMIPSVQVSLRTAADTRFMRPFKRAS